MKPMEGNPFDFSPEMFSKVPLFAELAKAMSWSGGPINWDLAKQIASAMASADHVAPIIDSDRDDLRDAARLAEAWLSESAGFPAPPAVTRVMDLTPSQWVDRAVASFPELLNPLGGKLTGALAGDAESAEKNPLAGVMGQLMPLLLGVQVGSVLGSLSSSLLTGYDVALPLEEDGILPILVPHVDTHARLFALDRRDVRYWVTLHATAHRMLYEAFPWTRTHFWSLYHSYLAAIDVNLGETTERLQSLDISRPEELQSAVGENLFGLGDSGFAGPALDRLHVLLGLLEAAAGLAVSAAAGGRLLGAGEIAASVARARTDNDGVRSLERFIGLEVPALVEQRAVSFCGATLDAGGWVLLNQLWQDPQHLPTAEEFANPAAWIARVG
ncbi:MAG: zinc-dependent metalloprotease [Actinomycetota bacterium]|nr:zinc-dependent metalloprotease [Actinomycetota bacterium]